MILSKKLRLPAWTMRGRFPDIWRAGEVKDQVDFRLTNNYPSRLAIKSHLETVGEIKIVYTDISDYLERPENAT